MEALGAACAQAALSARLLLAGLHELAGNALAAARAAVSPPPCCGAAVEPGSLACVTGASRGIGEAVAAELYAHGAHVVLACRSAERGEAAAARIRGRAPCARCRRAAGEVCVRVLDLASLRAAAAFAADFQAEHGARPRTLVFNACAPMAPPARGESADLLELQFATNFLAHLLIARELAPEGAAATRLVWMTSMTHAVSRLAIGDDLALRRENFNGFAAYADSKLAMVLAAAEFNRRLAGGGGASVACDPGLVDTGLARAFFLGWAPAGLQPALRAPLNALCRLLLLTPTAAAATVLFAATAPADAVGGKYVRRSAVARAAPRSYDEALAAWLCAHGGELLERVAVLERSRRRSAAFEIR